MKHVNRFANVRAAANWAFELFRDEWNSKGDTEFPLAFFAGDFNVDIAKQFDDHPNTIPKVGGHDNRLFAFYINPKATTPSIVRPLMRPVYLLFRSGKYLFCGFVL